MPHARWLASAGTVHARQPGPDTPRGARVTYRGGISRSKGRELIGLLKGRWRGTTIDLNFDHQKWSRHEEASRHLRFWGNAVLYSQTLRRLLYPDLALVGVVSALVISSNLQLDAQSLAELPAWLTWLIPTHPLVLPTEPFALSGFALGLLVTFRTQTSHSRYMEARLLWGDLTFLSRDMGSRLLCVVEPVDASVRAERERALRLLVTLAKTLKYHLTIDGCNEHIEINGCTDEEIQGAKDAALRDELACVWPAPAPSSSEPARDPLPDRLVRTAVGHRPLFVLHELGLLVDRLVRAGHLSRLDAVQLNERLLNLVRVVGGCERLFRTPIYTPYNHHTSRFLLLWTLALPAAMYPLVGPFGTAPVSLLMAWGMLGIEDIGSRIENPMGSLPLWQYVDTIDDALKQLRWHDSESRGPASEGEGATGESAAVTPSPLAVLATVATH